MGILVTGGAGYIGSATVEDLRKRGEEVVVIDNLDYGHRESIDASIPFYQGDIGDKVLVKKILAQHDISACMHFSAYAYVGESVEKPNKYFENNFIQTIHLLDVLLEQNVKHFVFSSTCAIYGEPNYVPIDEGHPQKPTNPYGWSKFMIERVLETYDVAYGLKYVGLRYFNACGATETHGESHDPETHLIPLTLYAALGTNPHVLIYGNDYPTPDGTAIRDYVHISDLSQAHLLGLDYLRKGNSSDFFNLGNGLGFSVQEVIETAKRITGKDFEVKIAPRRAGDPSKLVGDSTKARQILGWNPEFTDLESIVKSAWSWYQSKLLK